MRKDREFQKGLFLLLSEKKHSSFHEILIFVNLACYHGIAAALRTPTA